MKKSVANQIVKVWNSMKATEATKTKAVIKYGYVMIYPDGGNDGRTFFHTEEFVGISAAFRVSSYITARKEEINGEERYICVGVIY